MDFTTNIYFVDFIFQVTQEIKSLPPFHGARWNGFFRNICKNTNIAIEQAILGIIPFRSGQKTIKENQLVTVRLLATEYFLENLQNIVHNFELIEFSGDFNPKNHKIYKILDGISKIDNTILEKNYLQFLPFNIYHVEDEINYLLQIDEWHIQFYCPLRLKNIHSDQSLESNTTFCFPSFFEQYPYSSSHLLEKIRFCANILPDQYFYIQNSNLHWQDLRYNSDRKIALGGLVGWIKCLGQITQDTAKLLVLGQYFGSGKNPRFGFGWWRIPELDFVRKIDLPK